MSYFTHRSVSRTPLTRREALRRGSLFLGGALLGTSFLPKLLAQTAPPAGGAQSVDSPDNPIAKMRAAVAAAPLEKVKVGDRHFALVGHGGNIGVYVGDDSLVVVDSGSGRPPATERLRATLHEISDRPVRYLINTHWHFDHTDGNANLHSLGATIVGHRAVRTRLASPQVIAFMNAAFPRVGNEALPTVTFDQEIELFAGAEPIHVEHLAPAHTDSDAFVHWPTSNVVQAGDVYFSGTYPFIDGGTGGNLGGMIAAGEKILSLTNSSTRIIPGHGVVTGEAELKEYVAMLKTVQERLGKLRNAGKSADEAIAAKPLADLDEKWGRGMFNSDTFIRLVYSLPKTS